MFNLKSTLWHFTQEVYQEWYLGQSLYEEIEQKNQEAPLKKALFFKKFYYGLKRKFNNYYMI